MNRDDELLRASMLRYLDGAAPGPEVERLGDAVLNDPAARRELAELLFQDALLARVAQETEALGVSPASATTTRILRIRREYAPRRRSWGGPAFAAAALLAVATALAAYAFRRAEPRPAPVTRLSPPVAEERAASPPVVAPPPVEVPRDLAPVPPKAAEPRQESRPAAAPSAPERVRAQAKPDRPAPFPPPPSPVADSQGKPSVRPWEVAIARLDRVQGDASLLSGPVRVPAKAGQNLTWGQGLETGPRATASLQFADSTRLELGPGTVIWEASDRPGPRGEEGAKRIHLTAGTLGADVAKQAAGRPMVLVTPHGEAKVLGTSFKLIVASEATRIEMREGKIQITRKEDQAAVDVAGGFYVVVAKGVPLEVRPLAPTPETSPKGSRSK